MAIETRDYLLLAYLDGFSEPIKIKEESVPHVIKANFQFYGLDIHKYPDSIWVRLFELSKFKLVKQKYAGMYEITEAGRIELKNYQKSKSNNMVTEDMLLSYFYKQN